MFGTMRIKWPQPSSTALYTVGGQVSVLKEIDCEPNTPDATSLESICEGEEGEGGGKEGGWGEEEENLTHTEAQKTYQTQTLSKSIIQDCKPAK